ncbi:PhzF family phenazine biosynthesis protein [Prauserella shujinwangii]|uniref:PhzF family phenazine biosynthesis protein n=1 Tax=Prauserella shujinwangii TaxID=1453103 RepID=UPI000D0515C2|nr:PhzF family phenazine biosynthesis protein [Prauserella shujinwangii]
MRLHTVDAFAAEPFRGNPAGVVLLDSPADPAWMQAVANELGHADTAFVVVSEEPKPLRWFTPVTEVSLCGHATLAATHVLGGRQVFATRSGELRRLGRTELAGEQASPRGGVVRMALRGDRVTISGQAVTVTAGQLLG